LIQVFFTAEICFAETAFAPLTRREARERSILALKLRERIMMKRLAWAGLMKARREEKAEKKLQQKDCKEELR